MSETEEFVEESLSLVDKEIELIKKALYLWQFWTAWDMPVKAAQGYFV